MKQENFVCKKRGGRNSIFYERKPQVVFTSLLLLTGLLFARQYMEQSLFNFLVSYGWLVLSVFIAVTPLRVRCLTCESEWKNRVWWKLI